MKKYLIIYIFTAMTLFAQDSTTYKWIPSLVTSLNISQIAFSNWTKGGESSYSYVINVDWEMKYKSDWWSFQNRFKGGLGHSKTGDEESSITSNNMFNETVIKGDGFLFKPYISNIIRTPITNGYDYKADPAEQIAAFFDPGYITQSIGLAYEKSLIFQSRIGLALEESFASRYGAEPFRFESGIESITDVKYEVFENVLYKGKLRLFSGFERLEVWDVAMDNSFTAKVNSWLNVNLSYLIIYKKSESPKIQTKQVLQLGLIWSII